MCSKRFESVKGAASKTRADELAGFISKCDSSYRAIQHLLSLGADAVRELHKVLVLLKKKLIPDFLGAEATVPPQAFSLALPWNTTLLLSTAPTVTGHHRGRSSGYGGNEPCTRQAPQSGCSSAGAAATKEDPGHKCG